jgi:hypothetical protein
LSGKYAPLFGTVPVVINNRASAIEAKGPEKCVITRDGLIQPSSDHRTTSARVD